MVNKLSVIVQEEVVEEAHCINDFLKKLGTGKNLLRDYVLGKIAECDACGNYYNPKDIKGCNYCNTHHKSLDDVRDNEIRREESKAREELTESYIELAENINGQ